MSKNSETENFVEIAIYKGKDYHSKPDFDSVPHETIRNLLEVQL